MSGRGNKPTDRGALTHWRRQREALVRIRTETDRARCTHFLKMAEGGTCQDTETNRPTKAHSPTGDSKGRDLSGHGKKSTDRGALTCWSRQREVLVRTREKTDLLRCTHSLDTAEGGTCQDTEINEPTKVHSHSGDGRGRNLSRHGNRPTERGPLTSWRRQREGLVKTQKQTDRPRPTHTLEMAGGGTCQDTETNRPTEAHSPTGDGRGRYLSGQKQTD